MSRKILLRSGHQLLLLGLKLDVVSKRLYEMRLAGRRLVHGAPLSQKRLLSRPVHAQLRLRTLPMLTPLKSLRNITLDLTAETTRGMKNRPASLRALFMGRFGYDFFLMRCGFFTCVRNCSIASRLSV